MQILPARAIRQVGVNNPGVQRHVCHGVVLGGWPIEVHSVSCRWLPAQRREQVMPPVPGWEVQCVCSLRFDFVRPLRARSFFGGPWSWGLHRLRCGAIWRRNVAQCELHGAVPQGEVLREGCTAVRWVPTRALCQQERQR